MLSKAGFFESEVCYFALLGLSKPAIFATGNFAGLPLLGTVFCAQLIGLFLYNTCHDHDKNNLRYMIAFKTIQRRLIVLLVIPMTLFLLVFGVFGYHFIQNILLKE